MSRAFEENDIGITAAGRITVYADKQICTDFSGFEDGYIYDRLIYKDIVASTSAVVVRKEAFELVGLFDENLPARQDYDMWLRICKEYKIRYIRENLVFFYCDHVGRISTTGENHVKGTEMVLEKLLAMPELAGKYGDIKESHYRYLGIKCLRDRRYREARGYLKLCLEAKSSLAVILLLCAAHFPHILMLAQNLVRLVRRHSGWKKIDIKVGR